MNEPKETKPADQEDGTKASERTKQVETAGWTAGLSALFLVGALSTNASWPLAIGVVAIAAMVGTACYFMLRKS